MPATKRTVRGDHKITYMRGRSTETEPASKLSPVRSIRLKCLDCSGGYTQEVRGCAVVTCPLYPFRFKP